MPDQSTQTLRNPVTKSSLSQPPLPFRRFFSAYAGSALMSVDLHTSSATSPSSLRTAAWVLTSSRSTDPASGVSPSSCSCRWGWSAQAIKPGDVSSEKSAAIVECWCGRDRARPKCVGNFEHSPVHITGRLKAPATLILHNHRPCTHGGFAVWHAATGKRGNSDVGRAGHWAIYY